MMKKNCNKCRAYTGQGCDLGYRQEMLYITIEGQQIIRGHKPREECPKPKTYKKLLQCYD